jgi:hypothetical protein
MHITIAERLRSFTHTAGTYCVLPGSLLRFQIFPALLRVYDLSYAVPKLIQEIPVPVKGPVKEFTVQLDLEKGAIDVWGFDLHAYFRYRILTTQQPKQFALYIDKGLTAWKPEQLILNHEVGSFFSAERLSLGNHKNQDWERVAIRENLTEIFPIWLRLGQLLTSPSEVVYGGTAALFKDCLSASKENVCDAFINLFKVAFEGILSPRLNDEQHQGFALDAAPPTLSPLILLTEGARIIRSLFIRIQLNEIFVLPSLPTQFHCGRFLHIQCASLGLLDLEWTKHFMRRMIFHAASDALVQFHFPKNVKRYRLNGQFQLVEKPIQISKGKVYTFDNFQH